MLSIRRFKKRLKELNEFDMSYEMLGMRNGIKDYVKGILGYVDDLQESQYIGIDSAVITFRIPSHRQGELDHLYEGFMESPHTIVSGDGFVHRLCSYCFLILCKLCLCDHLYSVHESAESYPVVAMSDSHLHWP